MKIRVIVLTLLLSLTNTCYAQVFYSKTEAFELAFGKASIENLALFPEEVDVAKIQFLAKSMKLS